MASQTKKITLDTAALFFGRAVGLLLGMVRLNYLATFLGVANFGILNFATYFTALFQSLFDLGMAQLMTREIARNPSRSAELLGRAIILKVIIVVVASILVGIATLVSGFDHTTNWAVLLTTAALAINGISQMFLSAFQAHRKMVTVSVASIANDAIISAAIILMIPLFPSVVTALILTVVVSFINVGILISIYYKVVGRPTYRWDVSTWIMLLREGAPMAVSALGISIYTFIGPTILQYARGKDEVGIYSAGYKLISIFTLVPATFAQIVFPIFSDFQTSAPQKLAKSFNDALRVMAMISFPLAIGTAVLSPAIISFLYPIDFRNASFVLQVIILGNALGFLSQIEYTFLLALGKQVACMTTLLIVAAAVTLSSIFLVPVFGYPVVALIFMSTDLVLFASLTYVASNTGYRLTHPFALAKILFAAGLMGVILYFVKDLPLIVTVPVGGLIFFGLISQLKVLGDQEKEILSKLIQRRA